MDSTELLREVLERLELCEGKLVQEDNIKALLQQTKNIVCRRDEEISHFNQQNDQIENELSTLKVSNLKLVECMEVISKRQKETPPPYNDTALMAEMQSLKSQLKHLQQKDNDQIIIKTEMEQMKCQMKEFQVLAEERVLNVNRLIEKCEQRIEKLYRTSSSNNDMINRRIYSVEQNSNRLSEASSFVNSRIYGCEDNIVKLMNSNKWSSNNSEDMKRQMKNLKKELSCLQVDIEVLRQKLDEYLSNGVSERTYSNLHLIEQTQKQSQKQQQAHQLQAEAPQEEKPGEAQQEQEQQLEQKGRQHQREHSHSQQTEEQRVQQNEQPARLKQPDRNEEQQQIQRKELQLEQVHPGQRPEQVQEQTKQQELRQEELPKPQQQQHSKEKREQEQHHDPISFHHSHNSTSAINGNILNSDAEGTSNDSSSTHSESSKPPTADKNALKAPSSNVLAPHATNCDVKVNGESNCRPELDILDQYFFNLRPPTNAVSTTDPGCKDNVNGDNSDVLKEATVKGQECEKLNLDEKESGVSKNTLPKDQTAESVPEPQTADLCNDEKECSNEPNTEAVFKPRGDPPRYRFGENPNFRAEPLTESNIFFGQPLERLNNDDELKDVVYDPISGSSQQKTGNQSKKNQHQPLPQQPQPLPPPPQEPPPPPPPPQMPPPPLPLPLLNGNPKFEEASYEKMQTESRTDWMSREIHNLCHPYLQHERVRFFSVLLGEGQGDVLLDALMQSTLYLKGGDARIFFTEWAACDKAPIFALLRYRSDDNGTWQSGGILQILTAPTNVAHEKYRFGCRVRFVSTIKLRHAFSFHANSQREIACSEGRSYVDTLLKTISTQEVGKCWNMFKYPTVVDGKLTF